MKISVREYATLPSPHFLRLTRGLRPYLLANRFGHVLDVLIVEDLQVRAGDLV